MYIKHCPGEQNLVLYVLKFNFSKDLMFTHVQMNKVNLEKTMPKNWNLFGKDYAKELEFMKFSSKSYSFLVAKVLDLL